MQQEKNCACAVIMNMDIGHDITLSDISILGEFCRRVCMFDVDEIGLGMETVTMKAVDDYMELLVVMEVEMVMVLVMEIMMEIMVEIVMVLVMVMEIMMEIVMVMMEIMMVLVMVMEMEIMVEIMMEMTRR